MVRSKKQLAVFLSGLKSFNKPKIRLEQYATPCDIAAEWIWEMCLKDEVDGKVFADLACGPGVLGIGLLAMGAKKVHFLDCDNSAMEICKANYKKLFDEYEIGEAEFHLSDINEFSCVEKIDVVIQNPPFGTKTKHVDKKFLEVAFKTADVVYSMHKATTQKFVEAISNDFNFKITHHYNYKFPLSKTMDHHKRKYEHVDVDLWRMQKKLV